MHVATQNAIAHAKHKKIQLNMHRTVVIIIIGNITATQQYAAHNIAVISGNNTINITPNIHIITLIAIPINGIMNGAKNGASIAITIKSNPVNNPHGIAIHGVTIIIGMHDNINIVGNINPALTKLNINANAPNINKPK